MPAHNRVDNHVGIKPLLAILPNVSHYNMKTLLIILLIFIEASVFGQDYRNYDTPPLARVFNACRYKTPHWMISNQCQYN
jgi:hypothetical protein